MSYEEPTCLCGHRRDEHDADGDYEGEGGPYGHYRMSYGVCDVDGCTCDHFRDEQYGDED